LNPIAVWRIYQPMFSSIKRSVIPLGFWHVGCRCHIS